MIIATISTYTCYIIFYHQERMIIIFFNKKPRLVFDKVIDLIFEKAVQILGKLVRN